jgi:hypothetical protein
VKARSTVWRSREINVVGINRNNNPHAGWRDNRTAYLLIHLAPRKRNPRLVDRYVNAKAPGRPIASKCKNRSP